MPLKSRTTNGLANNSVLSLVVDSDGSLWVGMDGGGPTDRPLNRVTRSIFNLFGCVRGNGHPVDLRG